MAALAHRIDESVLAFRVLIGKGSFTVGDDTLRSNIAESKQDHLCRGQSLHGR